MGKYFLPCREKKNRNSKFKRKSILRKKLSIQEDFKPWINLQNQERG